MFMKQAANRLKMTKNYFLKKDCLTSFPTEFVIESTNRCNLRCTMCCIHHMKRRIGDMDFDKFRALIDEIKPYAELVHLHGLGEPLLHPRIIDMIGYCKKSRVRCSLSTNATVLHEHLAREILAAGLDYMILAVDGVTKETFEKVRQGADYGQVCKNIKTFLKQKDTVANTTFTVLQMVATEQTKSEAKDFIAQWKREKNVNAVRIKRAIDLRFLKERHGNQGICDKPCFYIWRQANIYWDGTASSCCMANDAEEVIGNVFEEGSFFKVWNSPRMRQLRKLHSQEKWSDIPLCTKCDIPQPSYLAIAGLTMANTYAVRKLLPMIEGMSIFGDFN